MKKNTQFNQDFEIRRARRKLKEHFEDFKTSFDLMQYIQWVSKKAILENQFFQLSIQKFSLGAQEGKEEAVLTIKEAEKIHSREKGNILKINQGAIQEEANQTIQDLEKAIKDTQKNDSKKFKIGQRLQNKISSKIFEISRIIKSPYNKDVFFEMKELEGGVSFNASEEELEKYYQFPQKQEEEKFLLLGGADKTKNSSSSGGADKNSATKRKRRELDLLGKYIQQIETNRVFKVEEISKNIVRTICQETDQVQISHLDDVLNKKLFLFLGEDPNFQKNQNGVGGSSSQEKAELLSTEAIESPIQIALGARLIDSTGEVWKVTKLGSENSLSAWRIEKAFLRIQTIFDFNKIKENFRLIQDCQKHKAGVSTYFETEGKLFKVIDKSSRFFNEICKVQAEELSGAWIFPLSPNNSKEFFFWDQLQYLEEQQ